MESVQQFVPTKENLFIRGIVLDPQWPICGREEETAKHIMWSCLSAWDVWGACRKKLQKSSGERSDFLKSNGGDYKKMRW